ncbi:uncharacterized protein LOC133197151 [Saccostrea echinata]|uniref:uncharacterized protein LOC133197151 n=1 Tax=Saccostrea echinata TaxID=191078 RepID=UPI002A8343C0|nr:uncharacterized protein LOC133197151 [Saccostrea echinata]
MGILWTTCIFLITLSFTGHVITLTVEPDCLPYEPPLSSSVFLDTNVEPPGINVCSVNYTRTKKEDQPCPGVPASNCPIDVTVICPSYRCCNGYSTESDADTNCPAAICDSQITKTGACQNIADGGRYQLILGTKITTSSGQCNEPNVCSSCGSGFYADGPKCKICGEITKCEHTVCSNGTHTECVQCEGTVVNQVYGRALTPAADNGQSCQVACSWRSDSTRCYPGICQDELAANCNCSTGFTGTHCEKITEPVSVTFNEAILEFGMITSKNPTDPNNISQPQPKIWVNELQFNTLKAKVTSAWIPRESPPDLTNHYVTEYQVGLVEGSVDYELTQAIGVVTSGTKTCSDLTVLAPKTSAYTCEVDFTFASLFSHNDTLKWSYRVKNGGYVKVMNKETTTEETFFYDGQESSASYTYHFDTVKPTSNSNNPLVAPDLTNTSSIMISWSNWTDDLSGISYFEYELTDIGYGTSVSVKSESNITANVESVTFTAPADGLYQVVLTCHDLAGNYKSARRVFLYDNSSTIDITPGHMISDTVSTSNTSNVWVVTSVTSVTIEWDNHFKNSRHKNNQWLNGVKAYGGIDKTSKYDDNTGEITINSIDHEDGIIDFKVKLAINSDETTKTQQVAEYSVFNIHKQQETFTGLSWNNGDRMKITVTAFDIMGMSKEDHVTLYKDTTPPEITDLWLTKEDKLDVAVFGFTDFNKMTIEWSAEDPHSGIDSMAWRIYDADDNTLQHGIEHVPPQGDSASLTECTNKYHNASRGADCYCTAFVGCFHKHFVVKPTVPSNGLQGVHDADYFVEVVASNKAKLQTVARKRISIDTSPPHTGFVMDGSVGQKEVDYQQGLTLQAHWSGFFDRESGVRFYQYGFSTECLTSANFSLVTNSSSIVKITTSTESSTTVTNENTYYITVVAYNAAYQPSHPVCSDGVTIDSSDSSIQELSISNSRIKGGLVTNSGEYWIVSDDRTRKKIYNTTTCSTKATALASLDLIPIERDASGKILEVDGEVVCASATGAPSDLTPVLSSATTYELNWRENAGKGGVYNYEIGIDSTPNSASPSILPFISTEHHPSYRFASNLLPVGTEFYFTIKTITKANKESIQSVKCILDTSAPVFTGSVSVSIKNNNEYLVASWLTPFTDSEDPFSLDVEYAIGTVAYGTQVQKFKPLQKGGTCTSLSPALCTGVALSSLDWNLHGFTVYYVTVKATNRAQMYTLATSPPYTHAIQKPTAGIVIEIPSANVKPYVPVMDIEDIDFQNETDRISARWWGFDHPHSNVSYKLSIGSTKSGTDIVNARNVGRNTTITITGITLNNLQTYYVSITASTAYQDTIVTSDGVTVVQDNTPLLTITVNDGTTCTMNVDSNMTLFTHHDMDNRKRCEEDIDFQASVTTLSAHWEIPVAESNYLIDIFIRVEIKEPLGGNWSGVTEWTYLMTQNHHTFRGLNLSPGRMYRSSVKFCARLHCFNPVNSNGVTILANNPVTGGLTLNHQGSGSETVSVEVDQFYDPDIISPLDKYSVVSKYEYAITDNSTNGNVHTRWTTITTPPSGQKLSFTISLTGTMDFSKCRNLVVRGYNKAGLFSSVSAGIKDCAQFNPILIVPNVIVDAVGPPDPSDDMKGLGVSLPENAIWSTADADYTPFRTILSAVWHSGRYSSYKWAVIEDKTPESVTYNRQTSPLSLRDPCSHSDVVHSKCGTTTHEYVNVVFGENEYLVHGKTYMICIHADEENVTNELWTNLLPELSVCTDGVIVDLTSPTVADVWLGNVQTTKYQVESSDFYVNWKSFVDIEELGIGKHHTGISYYEVNIGSTKGGNDVVDITNVGVVNHAHFGSLTLHSGHKYYATITGYDFVGRKASKTSDFVIVDFTPPTITDEPFKLRTGRHLTSTTEVSVCWSNIFDDKESGIDYYQWSVGSMPGYNDLMGFTKVNDVCATNDPSTLSMMEGHAYYINVRAYNRAGLSTTVTSWAFTVEASPPVAGHVFDGDKSETSNKEDLDFQTHLNYLSAYWEGFFDPHSAIKEYYISVGTCPRCQNVLQHQLIGIVNEYRLTSVGIAVGMKYYTSVTACNTADLCTTVTSDGIVIDNSPPTPGRVRDGLETSDIEYQASRSHISASWHGFSDPQSGLEKFVWKAGITPGGHDIFNVTFQHIHLNSQARSLLIPGGLPIGRRIYVTVGCYNNAGLYVEASSNGFIVDETGPIIGQEPSFPVDFVTYDTVTDQYYQVHRTTLKVEWQVSDLESHIERQYLTIKSHVGGDFNSAPTQINGIVRDYTFSNLDLHDGVEYYVTLISCNGAGLCSNATSKPLLVDSTPPNRGMFAVQTNHAANLSRHVDGHMTWTYKKTVSVLLAWIGFDDSHSNIRHYSVNIGSSFFLSDLNQEPGIPFVTAHNDTGINKSGEGVVQTSIIPTQSLTRHRYIYIHMWAENMAGLKSAIIHFKFKKEAGGPLHLVRRCDAYTCEGHCVCAAQDEKCPITIPVTCVNDTATGSHSVIMVTDHLGFGSSDVEYTPSDTVLQGSWVITLNKGYKPIWYQWSVGYSSEDIPEGVYDASTELVWHDAASITQMTFTTKKGQSLKQGMRYSFFVRAWYSTTVFADFKSNGVIISSQPPLIIVTNGAAVTEIRRYSTVRDMDFIKYGSQVTVDWTNKFVNASTLVANFKLYISTKPGGHNIHSVDAILDGSSTRFNILSMGVESGVRYYSNVIAFNHAGVHWTETSDGFVLDNTPPVKGVIYDGTGLEDLDFQDSDSVVAARWHGFNDMDSGIRWYQWCVGSTPSIAGDNVCDVVPWRNVGIHTKIKLQLSKTLPKCVYNKVYATDQVGYTSPIAVSNGYCSDTSSPMPLYLTTLEANIVVNGAFNTYNRYVKFLDLNTTDICDMANKLDATGWTLPSGACAVIVESSLSQTENSFLHVRGVVQQGVSLTPGLYRLTFVSSHAHINDARVANKEGYISLGEQKHVFMLYTKPYRQDGHAIESERKIISWHNHTFYFNLTKGGTYELVVGSVGQGSGIYVDDIRLQFINTSEISVLSNETVHGHTTFLHEWASVHAGWSFFNPGPSPIINYMWAIGFSHGGIQIQSFKNTGLLPFGSKNDVTLVHNASVYFTVTATNAVGRTAVSYSDRILVDLTPPLIPEVNDGRGSDEDYSGISTVFVNWKAYDQESGIRSCEWAVGFSPQSVDLKKFTVMTTYSGYIDVNFTDTENNTIYSSVRCTNHAGLTSYAYSDGIKISQNAPNASNVQITHVALSQTVYPPSDGFQGVSDSVRLFWSGFDDTIGISSHRVVLDFANMDEDLYTTVTYPQNQTVQYMYVTRLSMKDGIQKVRVNTKNALGISSENVLYNISLYSSAPDRNSSVNPKVTWNPTTSKFKATWPNVFSSAHAMRFEVSAGLAEGGAEILQWAETLNTEIEFEMPKSITDFKGYDVFVYIRAIAAGGHYTGVKGKVTLPS